MFGAWAALARQRARKKAPLLDAYSPARREHIAVRTLEGGATEVCFSLAAKGALQKRAVFQGAWEEGVLKLRGLWQSR